MTYRDCDLDKQDRGAATGHGMSLLLCFVLFCFTFLLKGWNMPPSALAGAKEIIFLASHEAVYIRERCVSVTKL